MWNNITLQDLKTQVHKSKSYKANIKDIQTYASIFQRYFITYRYAANCDKVIQCFVQIFVSTLHITNNQKIYQCFKKLINWINQDPNCRGAYYLIKAVVQICQRQFGGLTNKQDNSNRKKKQQRKQKQKQKQRQKDRSKQRDKSKSKQRDISKQRQKSRDRSMDKRQKQQTNQQTLKYNLKLVLSLVRKSGDKNMLIQDVYQIFVEYYLQRISKQIQQYNKNISGNINNSSNNKNKQKGLIIGSYVLTALSSLLAARNKTQVATIARQHIYQSNGNNQSSYISIYILLQLPNICQLLSPSITLKSQPNQHHQHQPSSSSHFQQDKITYHKTIQQSFQSSLQSYQHNKLNPLSLFILNKLLNILTYCIQNRNYKLIQYLYKLYPIQLQNCQDFIDRIYLHMTLDTQQIQIKIINKIKIRDIENWIIYQNQYIQQHIQYIEGTSIKRLDYDNFMYNSNSNNNRFVNVKYVVKLYVLVLFINNIKYKKINSNSNNNNSNNNQSGDNVYVSKKIIDKVIQYSNNVSSQQMIQFTNNISKLQLDCKHIIYQYSQSKQNINNPTNNNNNIYNNQQTILKNNEKYVSHIKQIQKWKQLIIKLAYSNNSIQKNSLLNMIQNKLKYMDNTLFQNWKIVLQALFQLSLVKSQQQNTDYQEYYSKQALLAFTHLSLRPSLLPKTTSSSSISPSYFKLTPLSKSCQQILQLILSQIDKQQIVSHIKKIMLDKFDKVDQQIIRDVIIYNIFLSKCLLLTNHIPKCKFMMELIVRECQQPGRKYDKIQKDQYLRLLLCGISEILVFDYCKFVASRDKLQMRLALFEKQCVGMQNILEMSLSDVVIRSYRNNNNNQNMMMKQQ